MKPERGSGQVLRGATRSIPPYGVMKVDCVAWDFGRGKGDAKQLPRILPRLLTLQKERQFPTCPTGVMYHTSVIAWNDKCWNVSIM